MKDLSGRIGGAGDPIAVGGAD
ncbi:MAG: hypothetical protein QOF70_3656, partial [Acetobacteraceae bacterium]|nr:hypothetical protein [Acetobacteraceae bacterium]